VAPLLATPAADNPIRSGIACPASRQRTGRSCPGACPPRCCV